MKHCNISWKNIPEALFVTLLSDFIFSMLTTLSPSLKAIVDIGMMMSILYFTQRLQVRQSPPSLPPVVGRDEQLRVLQSRIQIGQ